MITSNEITTEMRVAAYYVGARGDDIDAVLKMPYRHTYKKGDEWMDVYSRIGKAIIELRKRVIFLPCDLLRIWSGGSQFIPPFLETKRIPKILCIGITPLVIFTIMGARQSNVLALRC